MNGPARPGSLLGQLNEITGLERSDCEVRWRKAFKAMPPKHLTAQFMRRVLTHDLQCRKLGGHTAATRRLLRAALNSRASPKPGPVVTDGTVLVREWNGRMYRVEVTADGYVLDGKAYSSLSAIARHITGAKWSGPRFFGLTKNRSA